MRSVNRLLAGLRTSKSPGLEKAGELQYNLIWIFVICRKARRNYLQEQELEFTLDQQMDVFGVQDLSLIHIYIIDTMYIMHADKRETTTPSIIPFMPPLTWNK